MPRGPEPQRNTIERLSASTCHIRKHGGARVANAMTLGHVESGRAKQNFARLNY
jgi:hypothetical protein